MCCFVVKGLDKKISLGTVYKGVYPFIAALVITILLVMFIFFLTGLISCVTGGYCTYSTVYRGIKQQIGA